MAGEPECADALLQAQTEWYFFTDLSAAFEIYMRRPDLQEAYLDILDQHHQAFGMWLARHASEEHGCSPIIGEQFRRYAAAASLAQIFSYLARREDVARVRCFPTTPSPFYVV
jgi:hypothetical protein